MINRRIIRIMVLQNLFAYHSGAFNSLREVEKDLLHTFDKNYDLFFYTLLLIIELQGYSDFKIQKGKQKYLPSENDLNPSTIFINNKLISQLKENQHLKDYLLDRKYTWTKDSDFLKELFDDFSQTEIFKEYLNSEESTYEADKRIISFFVKEYLYNSEIFYTKLEDESIYWVDNVDFILKKVSKSINGFSFDHNVLRRFSSKFKGKHDLEFAKILLHKSLLKKDEYLKIIEENIVNWDIKRLSNIDRIILQMAIVELLDFNEIPIKVTLNEYIELAKLYGINEKSSNFVNGILDKIVKDLKSKNKIVKIGSGLKEK